MQGALPPGWALAREGGLGIGMPSYVPTTPRCARPAANVNFPLARGFRWRDSPSDPAIDPHGSNRNLSNHPWDNW